MPQYTLLFYDDPSQFAELSAGEMQAIIGRYRTWIAGLREKGWLVGGQKLRDDGGRIVRRQGNEVRVTDGPFSEAKEVLGGFVVIEADDYDQALERLQGCPQLDFGAVVVREIEPTDPA